MVSWRELGSELHWGLRPIPAAYSSPPTLPSPGPQPAHADRIVRRSLQRVFPAQAGMNRRPDAGRGEVRIRIEGAPPGTRTAGVRTDNPDVPIDAEAGYPMAGTA